MTFLPFFALQSRSENRGDAPADTSTPYEIRTDWQFNGAISASGDEDWIEVFLPSGSRTGAFVQFQIVGTGGAPLTDAVITLYDEQGNELPHFFPQIDQGFDDRLLFALPAQGTVYASVKSASGVSTGDYALQVVGLGEYYEGSAGNNTYDFSPSSFTDLVRTFAGNDRIGTGSGNDSIYAGDGDDTVQSGSGDNLIFGGRGNDRIETGNGNDSVHAGDGNDFISAGNGQDEIHAGEGDDNVFGGNDDDLISGGNGNDFISAGDGQDEIRAGDGDDNVFGGNGDDLISGGSGNDTLSGGDGSDTIRGGDGNDHISNAGPEPSLLFGGRGNDRFVGAQAAPETIVGGQGDDFIRGQGGGDLLQGGAGQDTVTYHGEGNAVTLSLTDQSLNAGAALGDVLQSIEVVRGTVFDDALTGNGFRNVLMGNDGDDTLDGMGGTDRLIGGQGNDLLIGGTESDRLIGGGGADVFEFRSGDGEDFVLVFDATEDVLRFAAGTSVGVTDDGVNTLVTYGADSVLLEGVVLAQGDITFEFV